MPTDAEVTALADAMWQLLDDMGEKGQGVCLAAKAQARIAIEPFKQSDWPELDMPLAVAQRIRADLER